MRTIKFLLLIIWALIANSLIAQDFAPIGAEWYYSSSAYGGAPTRSEYYHLVVEKDTMINNNLLRKINRTYYRYQGDSIKLIPYFIYQEEDTVFLYNQEIDTYYRLLIFNVKAGDTLLLDIPYDDPYFEDSTYRVVIDKVLIEEYNGFELEKYVLKQIDDFGWLFEFYLEKIGGYEWFLPIGLIAIPEHDGPIRCYHDNEININFTENDCEYRIINSIEDTYAKSFIVFPNPTSEFIEIKTDFIIDKIVILDYSGRRLFESNNIVLDFNHLEAGLYLIEIYFNNIKIVKRVIKY